MPHEPLIPHGGLSVHGKRSAGGGWGGVDRPLHRVEPWRSSWSSSGAAPCSCGGPAIRPWGVRSQSYARAAIAKTSRDWRDPCPGHRYVSLPSVGDGRVFGLAHRARYWARDRAGRWGLALGAQRQRARIAGGASRPLKKCPTRLRPLRGRWAGLVQPCSAATRPLPRSGLRPTCCSRDGFVSRRAFFNGLLGGII